MKTLTIKIGADQIVAYKARLMDGTPPEMGALYVLLPTDGVDTGKSQPTAVELTDGKNKHIILFDCVEVQGSDAFGFVFSTKSRSGRIGEFVSFS
ncbi:hypothetical protein [Paraburkholderia sp. XV]|uniref:hypothetical protein n=1 Tax=Paraburkholderia sp. XV TaxID=2831520 RepID=UPI001CD4DFEC|nr:hypothetical protein [Paraburkholderia sp. XV]